MYPWSFNRRAPYCDGLQSGIGEGIRETLVDPPIPAWLREQWHHASYIFHHDISDALLAPQPPSLHRMRRLWSNIPDHYRSGHISDRDNLCVDLMDPYHRKRQW